MIIVGRDHSREWKKRLKKETERDNGEKVSKKRHQKKDRQLEKERDAVRKREKAFVWKSIGMEQRN